MLLRYIKDKKSAVILFVVCTAVMYLLFFLYELPMSVALYGSVLCTILVLCVFFYGFIKYCSKHHELCILKNNVVDCKYKQARDDSLIEEDFANILEAFDKEYRSLISKTDTSRTELIDFYTLWVHQIKTPISAMSLVLQQTSTSEKASLQQELFKIERYTELVLGYLRIDSISSDLNLELYSLDSIVNQAVKKYAPIFIHKKIKIEMNNLNVKVLTDEKWLVFVVEQLLSNSLKYTKQGSIKIYTHNETILTIEDTGIGINPEDLPRIFEKGFTGFNGRMDKKSTGLGLYLCRKTLSKLGHKITVASEQGRGTSVYIDLSSADICIE